MTKKSKFYAAHWSAIISLAIAAKKLFRVPDELFKLVCFVSALLAQVGIFSTRWNVGHRQPVLFQKLRRPHRLQNDL